MTTEHEALDKVYAAECEGRLYQSNADIYKRLEADGLVEFIERPVGMGSLGMLTVRGWGLTEKGRYRYCQRSSEG